MLSFSISVYILVEDRFTSERIRNKNDGVPTSVYKEAFHRGKFEGCRSEDLHWRWKVVHLLW